MISVFSGVLKNVVMVLCGVYMIGLLCILNEVLISIGMLVIFLKFLSSV